MFLAALIVWCYGYALEGAVRAPLPNLHTLEDQDKDMKAFLKRVGSVSTPSDLENVDGRNKCLGLLMVPRTRFSCTRWELLREASVLLGNCCKKLEGNWESVGHLCDKM
jgi:hypothetical protein